MAIHNGIGFTSYRRGMSRGLPGAPAEARMPYARTMVNPLRAQVFNVVVGGTPADGDYDITITEPDGTVHTATFTRGSGETNDQISDGLVAAVSALASLNGVVVASDSGSAELDLTFEHEGIDYVVATSAPGTGTLVATETTDPAGVTLPIGRFVIDGGASEDGQRIAALPSGSAESDLLGVTMRPLGSYANQGGTQQSDDDEIPAGDLASVAREGAVLMLNAGGDATAGGQVHVVVNTAGGDELGQARGTDDGANSVTLPARNAYWVEDTAEGEVGPVYLRL